MKHRTTITHEFVEYIPDELRDGTIYVSVAFATAIHKCCCGCGGEVTTPLSPTDWTLVFDGRSISLHPSIGSWTLPCQSHYWILNDEVVWAPRWSRRRIRAARELDRVVKRQYFGRPDGTASAKTSEETKSRNRIWKRFKKKWF